MCQFRRTEREWRYSEGGTQEEGGRGGASCAVLWYTCSLYMYNVNVHIHAHVHVHVHVHDEKA